MATATPQEAVTRDTVSYRSGNIVISATLIRSARATAAPGVVIVHGSGTSGRDNPWTTAYAEALARRGIAVLYPDKRGSGASTGDWRTASMRDLANDAEAGVLFLRRQAGVDSSRVGVIGFSQGGYVASVVNAESTASAFAVVISGGTATLREQMVDEILIEAERRGQPLTDAETSQLRSAYSGLFGFAKGNNGWDVYLRSAQAAKAATGVLAHAARTLPTDSTGWGFGWLRKVGDFDPMPYWQRAAHPVLHIYGQLDAQLRVDASVGRLAAIDSTRRRLFTTVILGANGHTHFREDAIALLAEWIRAGGKPD